MYRVLLMVLLVDVLYLGSSITMSSIFERQFDQPFLLTWVSTSLFSLYLVPSCWTKQVPLGPPQQQAGLSQACLLLPVYFGLNYSFNASLEHTDISSTTTLSSSASLWTALFTACVLPEEITGRKVGSAFMTLLSVALLMTAESGVAGNGTGDDALGNLLALSSAILYGVYGVLLKRELSRHSPSMVRDARYIAHC